jgi:carboxyl-terminal processing protease
LKEDIGDFIQQKSRKSTSLNEAERRQERDAREAKLKAREALRLPTDAATAANAKPAKPSAQDDGLQANERSLATELAAEKASKVAKDVFLIEAANILGDQLSLIQSSQRLAQQVLSGFSRLKTEPGAVAR